jgi:prevent-host-death family protein
MRPIRVSDDIISVSEFKAKAANLLKKLRVSKQPLIITQNGKAAGVVLSPAAYDELTKRFRFMAAVEEGLTDAEAGRLHDHASVAAEMRATYKTTKKR